MTEKNVRKIHFGWWILLIVVAAITATAIINREWIYDFYRGRIYQPSSEMADILEKLKLTGKGDFLFRASQPVLNEEDDFNANCYAYDEESAVLGCYTEKNIFVYDITEPRLDGIRELTTAHELLHAVYERMSAGDKDSLRADLEKVYRENQDILKEEIEAYDAAEQLEEIYVRVGTEIKDLPASLEKHYAEIFSDQDLVVSFYNKYISVFQELENELDSLQAEMNEINTEIENKTDEYERRAGQLNADIVSFNSCADMVGCFESETEFYTKRNQLISEQNMLNDMYNEIDGLINQYNELVEKYNNNAVESNNLQNIINSHVKVEEI